MMKKAILALLAVCLMLPCLSAPAQEWVIPPADLKVDPVFQAGEGGPFKDPGSLTEISALPQEMLDALQDEGVGQEDLLALAKDDSLAALAFQKGKGKLFAILTGSPQAGYGVAFRSDKLLRKGELVPEIYFPQGQAAPRRVQLAYVSPEKDIARETLVMMEPQDGGEWQVGSYSVETPEGGHARFEPQENGDWKLTEWASDPLQSASFLRGKKMKAASKDFSLSGFPKTFNEAKKLSTWWYTVMPFGYKAGYIKFPKGKSWPVYTGPGEEYHRAANGKALVSTNGIINIRGWDDGWIMMSYLVTRTGSWREGYIKAEALPKGAKVALFAPAATKVELVEDALLTDEFLSSRSEGLAYVRKGFSGEYLAVFNDEHVFIECDLSDLGLTRGFVPVKSVILPGENFRIFESGRAWMMVHLATGAKGTKIKISIIDTGLSQGGTLEEIRVLMDGRLLGTCARQEGSAEYEELDIPEYQGVLSFVQVWDGVPDAEQAVTLKIPGTMMADYLRDGRRHNE